MSKENDWQVIQAQKEFARKKNAISNRKRLKAETVRRIDDLLLTVNSVHRDVLEGLRFGEIMFSLKDLADLKDRADKLSEVFSLERGER